MLILRVWRKQPGKYFCISTKSRVGEWKDHFFRRGQLSKVKSFIDGNKDKDLYWCPHGFEKPRRRKDCASIPNLLWADLDEADPRKMGKLSPSIAWESSPGRYAALWVIDSPMKEEVNRSLTYYLKADPGGWDLTQVLRLPGTLNYKYESAPRVRLLWCDGPSYSLGEIEGSLPRKKKEKGSETTLYAKYEKKLSGYARRQLLNGKPVPGKRSEVLWKLAHELIEAGATRDETLTLLKASPWNKFAGRRTGDEQLKREIEKVLSEHLSTPVINDDEDGESYRFLSRSMADVEEENLDWIWYPYLARGEVTILEGDPGLGKSYLAQMIAMKICDGAPLPCVKKRPTIMGKVAYFDLENSSGTVTKKRLTGNGGVNLQNFFQEEEPFSIDDDEKLDQVYEAIEELRPTLVVFDTLNTYIGSTDTHKAAETQQAFKKFIDIARRFNCSVMVLRHLTKSTKERALYRGQGSIAFTGLARVVLTVGQSPQDPNVRVMAVTKINVTKPPRALQFTIEGLPDTLKEQDRSRFVWGDFIDLSSDDIVGGGGAAAGKDTSHEDAEAFLRDFLREGAVNAQSALSAAEARSISASVIRTVAGALGVVKSVSGFGRKKQTFWSLPT